MVSPGRLVIPASVSHLQPDELRPVECQLADVQVCPANGPRAEPPDTDTDPPLSWRCDSEEQLLNLFATSQLEQAARDLTAASGPPECIMTNGRYRPFTEQLKL